jgi:hypothetical protein
MLTCIYHPLDPFRVVEHDEAERLIESGVWFDCPAKAKAYKKGVEQEVKKEKEDAEKTKSKGQNKGDKP